MAETSPYDQAFEYTDDPGTTKNIAVTTNSNIQLVIANAAETNTCGPPLFPGQILLISVKSLAGSGTRAITFSQAINKAANTIATMAVVTDTLALIGMKLQGGILKWRVLANDGITLS